MAYTISKNHTIGEYVKKYGRKRLEIYTTEEVNLNKSLLQGKNWWLINGRYYQVIEKKNNAFSKWWHRKGGGITIATCLLIGGVVTAAIVVPLAISLSNQAIPPEFDKNEIAFSGGTKSDRSFEGTIKAKDDANKQIKSIVIKIGDYTLKDNEYTYEASSGKILISKEVINSHLGKVKIIATTEDRIEIESSKSSEVSISPRSIDDDTGSTVVELTLNKKENNIKDITVKKGDVTLLPGDDYYYDFAVSKLFVNKEAMDKYYGKITITPTVDTPKRSVTQAEWLAAYKPYSDAFLSDSAKRYSSDKIKVTGHFYDENGKKTIATPFKYNSVTYAPAGYLGNPDKSFILNLTRPANPCLYGAKAMAGGVFSYNNIKTKQFDDLEQKGCEIDYIIGDDYVKYDAYKTDGNGSKYLFRSNRFNKYGYIDSNYAAPAPNASQLYICYDGEPSDTEKRSDFLYYGSGYYGTVDPEGYTFFNVVGVQFNANQKYRFISCSMEIEMKDLGLCRIGFNYFAIPGNAKSYIKLDSTKIYIDGNKRDYNISYDTVKKMTTFKIIGDSITETDHKIQLDIEFNTDLPSTNIAVYAFGPLKKL